MSSEQEIRKRIDELEVRLREITIEKGAAHQEGGGWHDNPAFDILQQEELMLREEIQALKAKL